MSHEAQQSLDSEYGVLKGPFWFRKAHSSALNRKRAKTYTVAFAINNALFSTAKTCKDNIKGINRTLNMGLQMCQMKY